jgi:hypothetical protein
LSSGTIAGVVIGSVAVVLLIAFGVTYWLRRRKTASRNSMEARPYVNEKEHGPELDGEDAQLHELEYTRAKGSELDGAHTGLLELDPQAGRKFEMAESETAIERHELP